MQTQSAAKAVKKPVPFGGAKPKAEPVSVVSGDELTRQYIEKKKAEGKQGVSTAKKKNDKPAKAPKALKPNAADLIAADLKAAQEKAVKAKADKAEAVSKGKAPKEEKKPVLQRRNQGNRAPTLEAAEQFQFAFDYFNDKLFKGELEHAMVSWEVPRKKNAVGMFRPDRWGKMRGDPVCHEITLNPNEHTARDTKTTLQTLVHEMCHLYIQQIGKGKVKEFHCKNWVKKMFEVGLEPIIVDSKGNRAFDKDGQPKETGRYATDKIDPDGPFMEVCDALLATGFDLVWCRLPDPVAPKSNKPKKPKARVKHTCPKCGEFAVAKRDHVLQCNPCKKKMEPDLSDSDNLAEEAAEGDE